MYFVVGLTAIYAMFLLALSKIALCDPLALGPFFIALLLFETTKRFFESWIAQMANYAFVTILTVMVAALMMGLVSTAAAASRGRARRRHSDCRCGAGVSGGRAHLSHHAPGDADGGGAGERAGLEFLWRGERAARLGFWPRHRGTPANSRGALTDRETTRWDALSRKAGFYARARRARRRGRARARLIARPNTIRPS